MNKNTKKWLIAGVTLVVLGSIIFAAVMAGNKWNFNELSTEKFETTTYEISEDFNSVSIDTDTADILFAVSDNEVCRVECFEPENVRHSGNVQDNSLIINVVDEREWHEHIVSINLSTPKITIYLPKTEYASLVIEEDTGDVEIPKDFKFGTVDISSSTGDVTLFASVSEQVKIETSTGDIRVENTSAGSLELSVSTGNVTVSDVTCEGDVSIGVSTGKAYLTNVACQNITSSGSTGDITMKNVIATEKFSIERSTGNVKFDGCDAAEIFITTDTGDVTGSLLTDKVFITQTDTGDVEVPKTVTGGRCEISTDTGDIEITVE